MSDWIRYSCQIALPDFNEQAQEALSHAKVLVVGMGGLGCPCAQYLVSSGIGHIGLADFDIINRKNLHRQILYTPNEIGLKKVTVAAAKLQAQNPDISISAYDTELHSNNVVDIISDYDIVVDCTDNFDTRYLLNDACVLTNKPLVYGAIYQYEGHVSIWNVTNDDGTQSPNYRDLYPDVNAAAVPNCADGGVLPTVAGIIGIAQANEVIQLITKTGEPLVGRLFIFDVQSMRSRIVTLGTTTKTNITSLAQSIPVKEIDVVTLQDSIKDYMLIDVRTTEERNTFHIGGMHIPLAEIQANDIDLEEAVVCYCATGIRSKEAVKILSQQNPDTEIHSLKGGLEAWQELVG